MQDEVSNRLPKLVLYYGRYIRSTGLDLLDTPYISLDQYVKAPAIHCIFFCHKKQTFFSDTCII